MSASVPASHSPTTASDAGDAPDPGPSDVHARRQVVETCRWLNTAGLNHGTSGNISLRIDEHFLISPSAVSYDAMRPEMVARMRVDDQEGAFDGPRQPSTEWRFHRDIYQARPDVGAIVHAHPAHATALAMARRPIPPCHYMITVFGGKDIRCAPYARYGSAALSAYAVEALEGRMACLLANHGMIALGRTLEQAKGFAIELEGLAQQYWMSLQIGGPVLLSDEEVDDAAAAIASYGVRRLD